MGKVEQVKVPDIGDFDEVDVVEVIVTEGARVAVDDPLITLESDKASMEVPAPAAGVVRKVAVKVGDKVAEGDVILELELELDGDAEEAGSAQEEAADEEAADEEAADEEAADEDAEETEAPKAAAPPEPASRPSPSRDVVGEVAGTPPHASPSVRRFARELGVDLGRVAGSGAKGRILKEDVQGFVKQVLAAPSGAGLALPPMPEVDFSKFGPVEESKLSRIRVKSAQNLHRSWLHVPRVTQFDEADITELEEFRKAQKAEAERRGVKLTPLAFLMKAAAGALREFPDLNSSLHPAGDRLIVKRYIHLGIAVDTPNGLVVPVVRDVDKKGIYELAGELGEVSARAREGKLRPEDWQGATFTISSLGGIGGTGFTPIVNAPEVAIMGVARNQWRPVWNGSEFVPRLIVPFSVAYDHRVVDGAMAVRFTTHLAGLLSDLRRLVL
ncbi:MAG TPA: dihydrolipoyllysine-residue acetyltransferase [Thermoanaerobaculia bacterium]|nr:dihydrolipoyllysine-residue acetyltransferase [Thermoanaerobaculia bacterium]